MSSLRIASIATAALGVVLLGLNIFAPGGVSFTLPLVFFMLGAGFFLLEGYVTRAHRWGAALVVPAVLLCVFGLIFLLNVLTGDWNAWAYAWLLLVAGLGLGVSLSARGLGLRPQVAMIGAVTAAVGLTLFALFGAIAGGRFIQVIAPILLVLGGVGLYFVQPIRSRLLGDRGTAPEASVEAAEAVDADSVGADPNADHALVEPLTPREKDVLRLLAQGHSNADIAAQLVLAPSTIKTHINNIYGKLGAQGRVQAVNRARELGLVGRGESRD